MKKQLIGFGVAALVFCGVGGAGAGIITTTANGINGYDWLSFDLTRGMSRRYVEANLLGTGQSLFGYRYATRLETELLLDSYYTAGSGDLHEDGVDEGWSQSTASAAFSFLNNFTSDLSNTSIYSWGTTSDRSSYFYYGSQEDFNQSDINMTFEGHVAWNKQVASYSYEIGYFSKWYGAYAEQTVIPSRERTWSYESRGSLLVNDHTPPPAVPTPEPATMLLFGTGFIGLVGSRIRKKKKQQ